MDARRGEKARLLVLSVVGLTFLSVWSDLVGHGSGYLESTAAVAGIANARIFFLAGLTLSTSLHFVAPKVIRSADAVIVAAVSVVSVAATLVYSFPPGRDALAGGGADGIVCAVGLFLIGIGYGCFVLRLICMVAYEGNYRHGVYALAASLVLKTLAVFFLSAHADAFVQVAFAVVSPVVVAVTTMYSQALVDSSEDTIDLMELPKVSGSDRRVLIALLIMLPVLRAMVRALSNMGLWGEGFLADEIGGLGVAVVGALVFLCSGAALVSEQGNDFVFRFIPPFLIVFAAVPFLDPAMTAELGIPAVADYYAVSFVELFSQVFHWALIIVSLQNIDVYPYRIEGLAYGIYGFASLLFVGLRGAGVSNNLVLFAAMFTFIIVLVEIVSDYHRSSLPGAEGKRDGEGPLPAAARGAVGDGVGPCAGRGVGKAADKGAGEGAGEGASALDEVAAAYGLSPRETEVFRLLMQGRSRSFIQNELFLAEGTVKTHTSRVYRKLGVDNKQEMITLVQQYATGEGGAEARG